MNDIDLEDELAQIERQAIVQVEKEYAIKQRDLPLEEKAIQCVEHRDEITKSKREATTHRVLIGIYAVALVMGAVTMSSLLLGAAVGGGLTSLFLLQKAKQRISQRQQCIAELME